MANHDVALMGHLMRRAGFGATRQELDEYVAKGYETVVEGLLNPTDTRSMPDDVIRRYHNEQSGMMGQFAPGSYWLYRMISTEAPLLDKVALFWHNVFATGYPKVTYGKVLMDQIRMFRHYGMGSLKTLLIELSKDPAMIVWLDNNDNHSGAINENYGRELLELFSMGVGNYTEQDIKECSRAFTGWTVANEEYMGLRARRDSIWPYGRIAWHFEYRADDHDDGEKEFLGQKGRFNGEDVIDIICRQPATARFISRHMYHFFVADEPPVPQWPYTPPRDPEAIEVLSNAYFESDYDIGAMLRALFNSDFFQSEDCWYEKVKSPTEIVAGVLRLSGEFRYPAFTMRERTNQLSYMGQQLTNPPSVEGWHQGTEWIDTGTLVERLNFASQQLSDIDNAGSREIMDRITARADGPLTPDALVDGCLDEVGALAVSDATRSALLEFASTESADAPREKVAQMLQLVVATPEFQRS